MHAQFGPRLSWLGNPTALGAARTQCDTPEQSGMRSKWGLVLPSLLVAALHSTYGLAAAASVPPPAAPASGSRLDRVHVDQACDLSGRGLKAVPSLSGAHHCTELCTLLCNILRVSEPGVRVCVHV